MITLFWLFACASKPDTAGPETGPTSSEDWGDPCEANPEHTELTIGVGEYAYEAVEDGATVELIHGPQGGYHIVLALRGRWFDLSSESTAVLEGTIGGEARAVSYPYVNWRCGGDAVEAPGLLLIYDAVPEDLDEQDTHVTATVTDPQGNSATAELDLHIADPLIP